jgi:gliding motility-associated-like protein
MLGNIRQVIIIIALIIPVHYASGQYISKDNYTGSWADPNSWIPVWPAPQTLILNFDVTIYGYITSYSPVSLNGAVDNLTVNDTLVIHGDLEINNSCHLTISDNGILIVRGNLKLNNQSIVTANGYMIITGTVTRVGAITQGSFTSNDSPPKVFICGAVAPSTLTANASAYPALNCSASASSEYLNSSCTYGNCTDLKADPIFPFFQSTCANVKAESSSPVCTGSPLILKGGPDGVSSYSWTGPGGFTSIAREPVVSASAAPAMAGIYTLTVTGINGCTAEASTTVVINATPTAAALSNTPVCSGTALNLTGGPSGMTTYEWTGPEGFSSGAQSPVVSASALTTLSGTYTLKVTDSKGCTAQTSVVVVVNPSPAVTAGSNTPVCTGTALSLTGEPSGMIAYNWAGPHGFSSTVQNPTVSSAATTSLSGVYTLTAFASNGCTTSASTTVAVSNPSTIAISSNSPVCEGDTIKLISSGGTDFAWSGPGGFSDQEQDPTIPDAISVMGGEYLLATRDPGGCSFEGSLTVTVKPSPVLTISDPSPACYPSTVDISDSEITSGSDPGLEYTYWTDAGLTGPVHDPSALPDGTYYIRGSAANGCYIVKPVQVIIYPLPDVSITGDAGPLCTNEVRMLTGIPAGGVFTVSSGPGTISGSTLSPTGQGVVNISYTWSDKCANSDSRSITVNDNPVVRPGPDQELNFCFETTLAAELDPSETGEWSVTSGTGVIEDIHSPVTRITGLSTGTSTFRWTVHSGNCTSSAEVAIKVNDLFIPDVITPNGDGKNDYFRLNALITPVELIILNRWGLVEYSNKDYRNDWEGRNDKGNTLKSDVYFYILKFGNGLIKKGTIMIIR